MNAVDLLVEVIREQAPEDIWRDSPLVGYRMLGNTNRGEIGEEFLRRYLRNHDIEVGNGGRTSRTDFRVGDVEFEVKTASLGVQDDCKVTSTPNPLVLSLSKDGCPESVNGSTSSPQTDSERLCNRPDWGQTIHSSSTTFGWIVNTISSCVLAFVRIR